MRAEPRWARPMRVENTDLDDVVVQGGRQLLGKSVVRVLDSHIPVQPPVPGSPRYLPAQLSVEVAPGSRGLQPESVLEKEPRGLLRVVRQSAFPADLGLQPGGPCGKIGLEGVLSRAEVFTVEFLSVHLNLKLGGFVSSSDNFESLELSVIGLKFQYLLFSFLIDGDLVLAKI